MLLVMAAAFNLSKFPGFGGSLYRAEFKDASGLHSGNMVQVAGMRVGRVKEVELETEQGAGDLRGRPRRRVRLREPGLDRGAQPARREVPRADAGRVRPARRGRRDPGRPHPVGVRHRRRLRRPDHDHRADRHRAARSRRSTSCPTPWTPPARTSRPACEGISRLSQTVASRDEEIQALLAELAQRQQGARRPQRGHRAADGPQRPGLPGAAEAQGGDPPAAGQRPDPGRRAARPRRGQPGADRARPCGRSTTCWTC